MRIIVANAFSKDGQGGNKAGVCLAGEGLTADQKQKIAKEMGYSETVFIAAADARRDAAFKLEYFTPSEEVPLCGHATIAAFVVMREKLPLEKDRYTIQTKSGLLSIRLENGKVFMEQKKPLFGETLDARAFRACFDLDVARADLPVQVVSTGLRDIMLPVRDAETLNAARPDFDAITRVSEAYDTVGIHAFALENGRIVCRNFAPRYDIPEESATGTSNCALACYLYEHDIVRAAEYTFEQGESMNEPSEINVKLAALDGKIEQVTVGGSGYIRGERTVTV